MEMYIIQQDSKLSFSLCPPMFSSVTKQRITDEKKKRKKKKNAHNTKIRSGSNRKRSPRGVQLDSGANEARADENDEHRTHRESNHCHHQINSA